MTILALESSSSSSKALIFDTEKGILKVETCSFPHSIDNQISQDTEGIYDELLKIACRICSGYKIDAIAIGSTWQSVIACDMVSMQPVTRTHTWMDTGAAGVASRLRTDNELTSYYYHNCGCMIHSIYIPFKLMHMREQGLSLSDKFIIDQGSYNFFRLTGKKICTVSMASGMGLLNIHNLSYEPEALKIAGISTSQLGQLGTCRDFGQLSKAAAREIGLPQGIPVIPAFPDGALNQVGAGAAQPGTMTLSVGTSAALRMMVEKPLTSKCFSTWCYVSAKDGWLSGAATSGACNCIGWVKKHVLNGRHSYRQLEDSPVDMANLPIFLPFIYGERCPGWNDERCGGFHDLRPSHGPADLFISTLEGVLFNIKQCYNILISLSQKPEKIMVSGGISNSPLWTQMLSDILEENIYLADMEQCSLVGGALMAAAAFGMEVSFTHETKIVSPKSAYHNRYKRYMELYSF